MSIPAPFSSQPCKPQVTRLPDGRIGIFIGGAYQFTDDAGARSLREQLDELLPAPTARELYEKADREFLAVLNRELEIVDPGSGAPPVIASGKTSTEGVPSSTRLPDNATRAYISGTGWCWLVDGEVIEVIRAET